LPGHGCPVKIKKSKTKKIGKPNQKTIRRRGRAAGLPEAQKIKNHHNHSRKSGRPWKKEKERGKKTQQTKKRGGKREFATKGMRNPAKRERLPSTLG